MTQPPKRIVKSSTAAKKPNTPHAVVIARKTSTAMKSADLRAYGATLRSDKAVALSFLSRAGILTPTGRLTKAYK